MGERPNTIARWCKEGWIEGAFKVNDEWRIPRSQVRKIEDERFRQRQRGENVTAPKPKRPPPSP